MAFDLGKRDNKDNRKDDSKLESRTSKFNLGKSSDGEAPVASIKDPVASVAAKLGSGAAASPVEPAPSHSASTLSSAVESSERAGSWKVIAAIMALIGVGAGWFVLSSDETPRLAESSAETTAGGSAAANTAVTMPVQRADLQPATQSAAQPDEALPAGPRAVASDRPEGISDNGRPEIAVTDVRDATSAADAAEQDSGAFGSAGSTPVYDESESTFVATSDMESTSVDPERSSSPATDIQAIGPAVSSMRAAEESTAAHGASVVIGESAELGGTALLEEQDQRVVAVFARASAALAVVRNEKLDSIASDAAGTSDIRILVEGYASSDGAVEFNMALSKQRAEAVRQYLVDRGVSESNIEVRGLGIANPVGDNSTPDGRRMNRRAEISVLR